MAAERSSNFAQTCNLLSQYLKEKRTQYLHGDPTFTVKPSPPPATMNLLNSMETSQPQAATSDQSTVRSSPMTIFYNGQVIVFNEMSPEKAKEIMSFATKGGSNPSVVSSSESSVAVKPAPVGVSGADLPIMRRASLHKFLAKRKERVIAVAPYQVNHKSEGGSSKQLELSL